MFAAIGVPPITRDGARHAAQQELSKGIYHRYDDPWPVRVFKWASHWIGRALDDIARHSPGGGAGAAALIVALVVLLVVARWRLGPMQRNPRLERSVLGTSAAAAADHRRDAETAAAAGRWADAIVARMRALARDLEERGDLATQPGRTADELAREVAALRPDCAAAVARAAAVFDEVAYGNRPGDAASYADVVTAEAMLSRRLVTAGSRR